MVNIFHEYISLLNPDSVIHTKYYCRSKAKTENIINCTVSVSKIDSSSWQFQLALQVTENSAEVRSK